MGENDTERRNRDASEGAVGLADNDEQVVEAGPDRGDEVDVNPRVSPRHALALSISHDRMEGFVICDPDVDTSDPEFALKEMVAYLQSQGIRNMKTDALRSIIRNAPCAGSFKVAEGTPPVDGEDGEVILNIERHESEEQVQERLESMRRVNYRAFRQIDNVKKGEVLARLVPATKGEDGHDVMGKLVKAKPGKPARLVAGKNAEINDTGLEARATCDGVARVVGGKLTVDPVFSVNSDVDYVVGNIHFVGDVRVSGDVYPDFEIRAAGSVVISGNVDKADISANTDVTIRGGLFGKPDALIHAGHDVRLHFAENAVVQAVHDIVATDSLMQCEARAGNKITLTGSALCCVGGRLVASGGIEANTLGSPRSPVQTIAQIQVDPRLRRLRAQWTAELEAEEDAEKIAVLQAKIATAERQIARQRRGGIVVKDTIYPGVEIIIDDLRYRPSNPLTNVRFSLSVDGTKILMLDA